MNNYHIRMSPPTPISMGARIKCKLHGQNIVFDAASDCDIDQRILLFAEYLSCYKANIRRLDLHWLEHLLLLVITDSNITSLDLKRNRQLEVLLAERSMLQKIATVSGSNLRTIVVDDTEMKYIQLEHFAELEVLAVQGSMLKLLDARNNLNLSKIFIGSGQICITATSTNTYFNQIRIPAGGFRPQTNQMREWKYTLKEYINIGIAYDGDL